MSFLIKCDPVEFRGDDLVIAQAPLRPGVSLSKGSPVFVWTSHTKGGKGLSFRGTIAEISWPQADTARLAIKSDRLDPKRPLPYSAVRKYKDDLVDHSPISTLSKKISSNARNGIVSLTEAEARFLGSHFE